MAIALIVSESAAPGAMRLATFALMDLQPSSALGLHLRAPLSTTIFLSAL